MRIELRAEALGLEFVWAMRARRVNIQVNSIVSIAVMREITHTKSYSLQCSSEIVFPKGSFHSITQQCELSYSGFKCLVLVKGVR
ncbi:hypothetical protein LINPERHAP1_LOCUS36555 [Linum perenne]